MRLVLDILFLLEDTINNQILGIPRRWLDAHLPNWLRYAVIAGVLFLSLALAYLAPSNLLPLITALPLVVAGLLGVMRWPQVGILAVMTSAMILPSPSLPGGLNLPTILLAALFGLWLLTLALENHRFPFISSRAQLPLFAMIGVAILSFIIGQFPWFPFVTPAPMDAQIGGLAIFILAVAAFLLVAQQMRDLIWLQIMTYSFILLAALFVAGWFVPYLGLVTGPMFQWGSTSNSLFWVFLIATAFSQSVFNTKLSIFWRAVLMIVVVYTFYVAFFLNGGWKSGYLPAAAAVAAILGARSWRAGLAVVVLGIVPAYILSNQAIATDEYSFSTRVDALLIMLEMAKTNPITGFGPANYYWYTPLFPIRGYAIVFNSHNQYADILAQTGILGLLCTGWFGWEVGRLSWSLKDRAPAGFAQAYVYGVFGGLVGMLASGTLADWFFPFTYNIGLNGFRGAMLGWFILGGIVTIEQIVRRQERSAAMAEKPDGIKESAVDP